LKALAKQTTDPNVQAAICRKLIQKIAVSPTGITIHYHVGEQYFRSQFNQGKVIGEGTKDIEGNVQGSAGQPAGPLLLSKRASRPLEKYRRHGALLSGRPVGPGFALNFDIGSNSLTSGRG